jgi:predicted nucleotidyltransferase
MAADLKSYEDKIKSIVLKYFKDEAVRVFLFGSRANKTNKYNSDFDVGLMSLDGKEVNFDKYIQTKAELDELIVKVDLVDFASKDDIFKEIALQDLVFWKK